MRLQEFRCEMTASVHTLEIHIDCLLPFAFVKLVYRAAGPYACVRDHDVHPPEFINRALKQRTHIIEVRNIGLDRDCANSVRSSTPRNVRCFRLVFEIIQREMSATFSEPDCRGCAYAS